MKSWVKLYTEINRDADIGSLTWAQRGIWSAMLALAGELDDRDDDDLETGRMDTAARVAWHLRIDPVEMADALAAFTERGMVEDRDGVLYLPNYAKRQGRAPSDRHTAVAERVKRHRVHRATTVQPECNEPVTSAQRAPDTESDTEPESDVTPPPPTFRETAFRAYENAIGLISGDLQSQEIGEYLDELEAKGLTDWWALAIQACADQNKRSWAYMRAVLKAWLAQGRPGDAAGARAAPVKADPNAETRSWDPLRELWEVYVGGKLDHTEKGPAPAAQCGSGAGGAGQPAHRPGRDGPGRGDGANGRGVVRPQPRGGVSGNGRARPTGQAG